MEGLSMILSLRKIGGNAISIFTSDAMNRATNFVLYALVARHLGAREFGQLSLALTLFYVFQVSAVAGVKMLITRQVAKDRSQTGRYFVNACMGAMFTSLCSSLALFGFVHWLHYAPDTSRVILLLSAGLFPYAVSAVCEGIFQAWEQMRYIACVNVPVNAAKIGFAFLLLSRWNELFVVVLILFFSLIAIAAMEVWIVVRRFPWKAPFQPGTALSIVRSASPFLGIEGVAAIIGSVNIVLLSKLANEAQVGLFNAATQLMAPLLLVYQSSAMSIFPMMCRKVEPGFQSLKRISESAIELLLILALPSAAGLFFLGDWAISILYKSPVFLQAFPALKIMTWTLLLRVFSSILGQTLVASHRERVNLRIVAVDTLVNVLVGWPLISYFGLVGAAIATLLTSLADFSQHYIAVSRLIPEIQVARYVWKPFLACACMVAYLASTSGHAPILTGFLATSIYVVALLALTIWACGGLRQFKKRHLPVLSS
jgi:O-antigen/teichoic acid export membrane protein